MTETYIKAGFVIVDKKTGAVVKSRIGSATPRATIHDTRALAHKSLEALHRNRGLPLDRLAVLPVRLPVSQAEDYRPEARYMPGRDGAPSRTRTGTPFGTAF